MEPFACLSTESLPVGYNSGQQFGSRARPPLRQWVAGDIPNTRLMRVSDYQGDGKHYYSSRQAWNSDMSKFMVGDGLVADNKILDVNNNYSLLSQTINLTSRRVWSHTQPNILYGQSGDGIYRLNCDTGQRTLIFSQPGIDLTSKMTISFDDTRAAIYDTANNRIIALNLQTGANMSTPMPPGTPPPGHYVGVSNSGRWIITTNGGTYWKIPWNNLGAGWTNTNVNGAHSDLASNTNGDDVVVSSRGNGSLSVLNLDQGGEYFSPQVIDFNPATPAGSRFQPDYVSGRGQQIEGWVILSGEAGDTMPNFPLAAYRIDPTSGAPVVKVIGYDHHVSPTFSAVDNFDRQIATMSPDGQCIAFTSDFGVLNGPVSTYVICCDETIVAGLSCVASSFGVAA